MKTENKLSRKSLQNYAQSVNFREIIMGNIKPNTLYRSSHPIKDNEQENKISLLATQASIAAVLNLCDTNSEIARNAIFVPWYNKLYKNGQVIALGIDYNISSDSFNKKLRKGMQFIINTEGPWLIHCIAGIDRTGFVSVVLEAFMGSTLDEIINDYLQSFNSIYDSSIYREINKEDSCVVMQFLSNMSNDIPVNDHNLQIIAENYLMNSIKLSVDEIELLKNKLAKDKYK
jgi:protein-tyrosine phosphatase